MKFTIFQQGSCLYQVAPLVGAWIEIAQGLHRNPMRFVAPLVGAWIEMLGIEEGICREFVAPLVGAWIEMQIRSVRRHVYGSRSPCGSVD